MSQTMKFNVRVRSFAPYFAASVLDPKGRAPAFADVELVVGGRDGGRGGKTLLINKLVLSAACPLFESTLLSVDPSLTVVVMFPDFSDLTLVGFLSMIYTGTFHASVPHCVDIFQLLKAINVDLETVEMLKETPPLLAGVEWDADGVPKPDVVMRIAPLIGAAAATDAAASSAAVLSPAATALQRALSRLHSSTDGRLCSLPRSAVPLPAAEQSSAAVVDDCALMVQSPAIDTTATQSTSPSPISLPCDGVSRPSDRSIRTRAADDDLSDDDDCVVLSPPPPPSPTVLDISNSDDEEVDDDDCDDNELSFVISDVVSERHNDSQTLVADDFAEQSDDLVAAAGVITCPDMCLNPEPGPFADVTETAVANGDGIGGGISMKIELNDDEISRRNGVRSSSTSAADFLRHSAQIPSVSATTTPAGNGNRRSSLRDRASSAASTPSRTVLAASWKETMQSLRSNNSGENASSVVANLPHFNSNIGESSARRPTRQTSNGIETSERCVLNSPAVSARKSTGKGGASGKAQMQAGDNFSSTGERPRKYFLPNFGMERDSAVSDVDCSNTNAYDSDSKAHKSSRLKDLLAYVNRRGRPVVVLRRWSSAADFACKEKRTPSSILRKFLYPTKSPASSATGLFKCTECPNVYTQKCNLHRHFKKEHNEEFMDIESDGSEGSMASHISRPESVRTKTENVEPRTPSKDPICPYCGKDYGPRVRRHVETVHLNMKKFQCKTCGHQCYYGRDIISHVKSFHLVTADDCGWTRIEMHTGDELKEKDADSKAVGHSLSSTSSNFAKGMEQMSIMEWVKCEHCGKMVSKRCKRWHVESVHMGIRNFECKYCAFTGYFQRPMRLHVEKEHPGVDNSNDCHWNKITTRVNTTATRDSNPTSLSKSRTTTSDGRSCQLCKKTFSMSFQLRHHFNAVHKKIKRYRCTLCLTLKSYYRNDVLKHIRAVHGKSPAQAEKHCAKLDVDEKKVVLESDGRREPDKRLESDSRKSDKHARENENAALGKKSLNSGIISCKLCPKSFAKASLLDDHFNAVHENVKRYRCPLCSGFETHSMSDLVRHLGDAVSGHGLAESHFSEVGVDIKAIKLEAKGDYETANSGAADSQRVECAKENIGTDKETTRTVNDECSTDANNAQKDQTQSADTQGRTCTHCGKRFKFHFQLRNHVDSIHLHVKNFQCKKCSYKCYHKFMMAKHIRNVHAVAERDIARHLTKLNVSHIASAKKSSVKLPLSARAVCKYCKKDFGNTSKPFRNLKVHIETLHMHIKRFKCSLCGYKSYRKQNLVRHLLLAHSVSEPVESVHWIPIEQSRGGKDTEMLTEQNDINKCAERSGQVRSESAEEVDKVRGICKYCGKDCRDSKNPASSLKEHVEVRHLGIKRFACAMCDSYNSYYKVSVFRHLENHHSLKEPVEAVHWIHISERSSKLINVTLNSITEDNRHLNTKRTMYSARKAIKQPPTSKSNGTGKSEAAQSASSKSVCKLCHQHFRDKKSSAFHLRRHMESHHQNVKRFKCLNCDKFKTYFSANVIRHVTTVHSISNPEQGTDWTSIEREQKGDRYKASTGEDSEVERSCKTANVDNSPSSSVETGVCKYCGKDFRNNTQMLKNLVSHIECVHLKIKKAACKMCTHKSYFIFELCKHLKNSHSVSKPVEGRHWSRISKDQISSDVAHAAINLEANSEISQTTKERGEISNKSAPHIRRGSFSSRENSPFVAKMVLQSPAATVCLNKVDNLAPTTIAKGVCKYCGKDFRSKVNATGDLRCHVESLHLKLKRFKCALCDCKSYKLANIKKHLMNLHSVPTPIEDRHWSRVSWDRISLERARATKALQMRHEVSSKSSLMPHAGVQLLRRGSVSSSPAEFAKIGQAALNTRETSNTSALHIHRRGSLSSRESSPSAPKMASKSAAAAASDTITDCSIPATLAKGVCTYCGKDFRHSTTTELRCHVESVHLKLKRYKCALCDYKCYYTSNVKQHLMNLHSVSTPIEDRHWSRVSWDRISLERSRATKALEIRHAFATKMNLSKSSLLTHVGVGSPRRGSVSSIESSPSISKAKTGGVAVVSLNSRGIFNQSSLHTKRRGSVSSRESSPFTTKLPLASPAATVSLSIKQDRDAIVRESVQQQLCLFCRRRFPDSKSTVIAAHIRSIHFKITRYACAQCPYRSYFGGNYRDHVRTHGVDSTDSSDGAKYTDPALMPRSLALGNVAKHAQNVGGGDSTPAKSGDNIAPNSGKIRRVFAKKSTSKQALVHSPRAGSAIKRCPTCDKEIHAKNKTQARVNLQRHINSIHLQIKNYDCPFCDYQTFGKREMEKHIDRRHFEELQFVGPLQLESRSARNKTGKQGSSQGFGENHTGEKLVATGYSNEKSDAEKTHTFEKQVAEKAIKIETHTGEKPNVETSVLDKHNGEKPNIEASVHDKHTGEEPNVEASVRDKHTGEKPNAETLPEKHSGEKPNVEASVHDKHTVEKPNVKASVHDKHTGEKPNVEASVHDKHSGDKPNVEASVHDKHTGEKPNAEESVHDKHTVEKPNAETLPEKHTNENRVLESSLSDEAADQCTSTTIESTSMPEKHTDENRALERSVFKETSTTSESEPTATSAESEFTRVMGAHGKGTLDITEDGINVVAPAVSIKTENNARFEDVDLE